MKKMPEIKSDQFAVLMAEGATGIILTLAGKRSINDEDEVWVVFDDINAAVQYISEKQAADDTIEFGIYDQHQEPVAHHETIKRRK